MTYSQIDNGIIVKSRIRKPTSPTVSFPDNATDQQYADHGFYLDVLMPDPIFDSATHYLQGFNSVIAGQTVEHTRIVVAYTQQELDDMAQAEADRKDINKTDKLMKALALTVLDELQALGSTTTTVQFRDAIITKYNGIS